MLYSAVVRDICCVAGRAYLVYGYMQEGKGFQEKSGFAFEPTMSISKAGANDDRLICARAYCTCVARRAYCGIGLFGRTFRMLVWMMQ